MPPHIRRRRSQIGRRRPHFLERLPQTGRRRSQLVARLPQICVKRPQLNSRLSRICEAFAVGCMGFANMFGRVLRCRGRQEIGPLSRQLAFGIPALRRGATSRIGQCMLWHSPCAASCLTTNSGAYRIPAAQAPRRGRACQNTTGCRRRSWGCGHRANTCC